MKNVQVIVLAAGKGTRMQSDLPKALTPLRGKPFLNYVLDAIEGVGLSNKPVVVTGYKRELLAPHIPESHTVVVQEEQLGTGHAVKITRDAVGEDVDIAVVLFADQPLVTSTTIRNLIKKHIEASDATITMATTDIGDYDEWRKDAFDNFGRIVRNPDGSLAKIVERKNADEDERKITEVNPAYFVFDAKWMWEKLDELKNDNAQGEYYLVDLPGIAFNEGKKINTIPIGLIEALGANTKEQLDVMERLSA